MASEEIKEWAAREAFALDCVTKDQSPRVRLQAMAGALAEARLKGRQDTVTAPETPPDMECNKCGYVVTGFERSQFNFADMGCPNCHGHSFRQIRLLRSIKIKTKIDWDAMGRSFRKL